MTRVGLLGWNGRLNAGDDAMAVMLARAVGPGAALRVYADHDQLPRQLRETGAVGQPLFNASLRNGKLHGLVRRIYLIPHFLRGGLDLLIIGGGSILRDPRTMANYRAIAARVRATNPAAHIIAAGVSVGPFSAGGEAAFCRLLPMLDALFVRDSRSLDVAVKLVRETEAETETGLFPDPAFAVFHDPMSQDPDPAPASGTPRRIGLILRAGEREAEQVRLVEWLSRLDPGGHRISLIPFCAFRNGDDHAFAARMAPRLNGLETEIGKYAGDLGALARQIAACDIVVSVRLHGLIHAIACAKPALYFAYQPKLEDIAADAGLGPDNRIDAHMLTRDPNAILATLPAPDPIRAADLAAGAARLAEQLGQYVEDG